MSNRAKGCLGYNHYTSENYSLYEIEVLLGLMHYLLEVL